MKIISEGMSETERLFRFSGDTAGKSEQVPSRGPFIMAESSPKSYSCEKKCQTAPKNMVHLLVFFILYREVFGY